VTAYVVFLGLEQSEMPTCEAILRPFLLHMVLHVCMICKLKAIREAWHVVLILLGVKGTSVLVVSAQLFHARA
jgi:hypothetical protein